MLSMSSSIYNGLGPFFAHSAGAAKVLSFWNLVYRPTVVLRAFRIFP
ncbi:hypothetical protein BH10PLA2_BH10PLA2_20010 [soil metagenome]